MSDLLRCCETFDWHGRDECSFIFICIGEACEHARIRSARSDYVYPNSGPGVVDGHIQATEARDGLIDQAAYIVLVAHVGAQEFGLTAEVAEFGDQFTAGFLAST